ncbi:signal peptide, CUB and EGF-like domain-containing protein 1 isoform X2 [Symsagittifera roscoffensis]|uniref:signal peptide, CUB and EGF-like domain-containing protein 1 isoform X2 n=1 Tax=Symsagittifera roscoffensis TaxID=84072 RepID=UPI00307CA1A8
MSGMLQFLIFFALLWSLAWSSSFSCSVSSCQNGGLCTSVGSCTCASGYIGDDCGNDLDECATSNGGCEDFCSNTVGSFTCSCTAPGYEVSALNFRSCVDTDECDVGSDTCDDVSTTCSNTPGSFTCSCRSGFDPNTTDACTDVDECALNTNSCDDICTNTPGSYTCSCSDPGEILLIDGFSCSGTCSVDSECNGPTNGVCDTSGSNTCNCNAGYQLADCSQDTNECATNNGNCQQTCTNSVGSFNCGCTTGYETDPSDSFQCNDIDECLNGAASCSVDTDCVNSMGSFSCDCGPGYEQDPLDASSCIDTDECTNGVGCPTGTCTNTIGSFTCNCHDGYEQDATNSALCTDINECEEGTDTCSGLATCSNVPGSFVCTCPAGYEVSPSNPSVCRGVYA